MQTGTSVALKILSPTDRPEDARRFLREAALLARLRSPHTVHVLGRGPTGDGSLYVAMELLTGSSLTELLKDGKTLSECDAVSLASQVLLSLEEAHGQGLVHRDLKPSNLMVSWDSGRMHVRVLDFGIAQTVQRADDDSGGETLPERMTATGRVMGTPGYMSPEQCQGLPLDGRSDLYSLGVLLYRAVAGELPFDDPNPLTLMYHHVHAPVRDLMVMARRPISPGFASAVQRAMAKLPQDRFADARAMRLVLEACEGVQPRAPMATVTGEVPVLARDVETPESGLPVAASPHGSGAAGPLVAVEDGGAPDPAVPAPSPSGRAHALAAWASVAFACLAVGAGWYANAPRQEQPAAVVSPSTAPGSPRAASVAVAPPAGESAGDSDAPMGAVPRVLPPAVDAAAQHATAGTSTSVAIEPAPTSDGIINASEAPATPRHAAKHGRSRRPAPSGPSPLTHDEARREATSVLPPD